MVPVTRFLPHNYAYDWRRDWLFCLPFAAYIL